MGTMRFLLPPGLSDDAIEHLERACIIGGPDNMPWPTDVQVDADALAVLREVDESGCLVAPWHVNGTGHVMSSTATLMERDSPYHFQVELARGKINQLRCQASDWRTGGLQMTDEVAKQIREVSRQFGQAVVLIPAPEAGELAQEALSKGYQVSDELVQLYIDQVFQIRHGRQPQLDTTLSCRLDHAVPDDQAAEALTSFVNSVDLPFSWPDIEPTESNYQWETQDALVDWAEAKGLPMVGGPLIDLSPQRFPEWLNAWDGDVHSLAGFMCDYVGTVVRRYHGRMYSWRLTAGTNMAKALSLGEDEILWLTVRLAEAARQIDSGLELIVGVSQPWGDYMALEDRTHSPFIFADTLIRAGLNLAAVELDWVVGLSSPASYCRDLLESSRLLDLYALLGVPLEVTLGYPSGSGPDPKANPEVETTGGHWRSGLTPEVQAEWAAHFGALALCKPYVRAVNWTHFSDAEPHYFPHCGLLDGDGKPKPALERLRQLREQHLR